VHRETPGVRFGEPWNHLGMRATGSHEVIFENVRVPADHAVDLQLPGLANGMDPVTALWMNVLALRAPRATGSSNGRRNARPRV
jgi:alkylation response protein AidB-like acyl-CoA dehydrogenase